MFDWIGWKSTMHQTTIAKQKLIQWIIHNEPISNNNHKVNKISNKKDIHMANIGNTHDMMEQNQISVNYGY